MNILYDFHMHSFFSGDSDTPSSLMADRAVQLGLKGLCFTEHQDFDAPEGECDFNIDFEAYFPHMRKLREAYRDRLQIGIGMEFGIQPHLGPKLTELLDTYTFDFIIASLHFVGGEDPYYLSYFEGHDEAERYAEFFRVQLESLKQCTEYDTVGHLDYVIRKGPNRKAVYSYEAFADCIDPLLQHIIDNGKCLEVNTGGYKYGLGEPNPCIGILRRYRELGGELITIGSDAHCPEHLCYDFAKAESILRELGYKYYAVFQDRRREMLPL